MKDYLNGNEWFEHQNLKERTHDDISFLTRGLKECKGKKEVQEFFDNFLSLSYESYGQDVMEILMGNDDFKKRFNDGEPLLINGTEYDFSQFIKDVCTGIVSIAIAYTKKLNNIS